MTIIECGNADFETILEIINDAARAYKGVIPGDRWHEPYMSSEELKQEVATGVRFWGAVIGDCMCGVMGIQDRGEVCLIRHAYVRTANRRQGIGTALLRHLEGRSAKPVLIGTWSDASWAINFYARHGYFLLPQEEKTRLLHKFWNIPERQIETSVVLADARWLEKRH